MKNIKEKFEFVSFKMYLQNSLPHPFLPQILQLPVCLITILKFFFFFGIAFRATSKVTLSIHKNCNVCSNKNTFSSVIKSY